MAAFSYVWLSSEHPDPDCWHLNRIAEVLRQAAQAKQRVGNDTDMAVFWDWPSIPQKPRTPAEDQWFKLALGGMQLIYGNDLFWVLKMKHMPQPAQCLDEKGHFHVLDKHGNPKVLCWPYEGKGWCYTEDVISNARKRVMMSRMEFGNEEIQLSKDSVSQGLALHPEAFRRRLAEKVFSNSSDHEVVYAMYLNTFEQCLRFSTEQLVVYISFERAHLVDYCEALATFSKLQEFHAGNCDFGGDVGFQMLLHTLALAPQLDCLTFRDCRLTDTSLAHFKTMEQMSSLRFLDLHGNNITDEGAARLAKLLPAKTPSLERLRLCGGNAISMAGIEVLRAALGESCVSTRGLSLS